MSLKAMIEILGHLKPEWFNCRIFSVLDHGGCVMISAFFPTSRNTDFFPLRVLLGENQKSLWLDLPNVTVIFSTPTLQKTRKSKFKNFILLLNFLLHIQVTLRSTPGHPRSTPGQPQVTPRSPSGHTTLRSHHWSHFKSTPRSTPGQPQVTPRSHHTQVTPLVTPLVTLQVTLRSHFSLLNFELTKNVTLIVSHHCLYVDKSVKFWNLLFGSHLLGSHFCEPVLD